MRILIIGAGVGGMTLAALLKQRGERPHIIERAAGLSVADHSVALYPLGSRALHELGLFERFVEIGIYHRFYDLGNDQGELLHHYDCGQVSKDYNSTIGVRRSELVQLVASVLGNLPIHFDTTVTALESSAAEIRATFSDGSTASFDLAVGADGIHSATRAMILGPQEFKHYDTGWGCWVTWAAESILPPETMAEYWGDGYLIGISPVNGAQSVMIAGPKRILKSEGPAKFAENVRNHLRKFDSPVPAALDAIESDKNPFFWDLRDCRCRRWWAGRVVLLGDAAAGFLPTAATGASMAMFLAWTLTRELARTDAAHVKNALRLYVSRTRPYVQAAQDDSRKLARIMMVQ